MQLLKTREAKHLLARLVRRIGAIAGLEVTITRKRAEDMQFNKRGIGVAERMENARSGTNLNIGCGNYIIEGFANLDSFNVYYHCVGKKNFAEYDLRKSRIPYGNGVVDNIYISHVIEHVEEEFVCGFIQDSYRVLKPSGVLRICCPDAEFLFKVSKFQNDFWAWRKEWFRLQKSPLSENAVTPEQMDFFIREISTPRSRFYMYRDPNQVYSGKDVEDLSYEEALRQLTDRITFRQDYPGDHISGWDFERLHRMGKQAGFRHILRSKPGGSVSLAMQGTDMDLTHPQMTLYVDMVK